MAAPVFSISGSGGGGSARISRPHLTQEHMPVHQRNAGATTLRFFVFRNSL